MAVFASLDGPTADLPPGGVDLPLVSETPIETELKRTRLLSSSADEAIETATKLKINLGTHRKGFLNPHRISAAFRLQAKLSLRVAFAVTISSIIQTRDEAYDLSHAYAKKWLFFLDWYYLGGLSHCAIMVVFSMAFNVGGTIREVCQGVCGVGVALLYNYALFAFIEVETFDSQSEDPYKNYYMITKALSSSSYWVNVPNLIATLPWIIVFTIAVMVLPFHCNTRKYALGTNVYFTLTRGRGRRKGALQAKRNGCLQRIPRATSACYGCDGCIGYYSNMYHDINIHVSFTALCTYKAS